MSLLQIIISIIAFLAIGFLFQFIYNLSQKLEAYNELCQSLYLIFRGDENFKSKIKPKDQYIEGDHLVVEKNNIKHALKIGEIIDKKENRN